MNSLAGLQKRYAHTLSAANCCYNHHAIAELETNHTSTKRLDAIAVAMVLLVITVGGIVAWCLFA